MIGARNIQDENLNAYVAVPAAGANATGAAIDLRGPNFFAENIDFLIKVPALPNLVAAKTVTITVEQSADGVTYAAHPAFAPVIITGAVGNGAAATSERLKLPAGTLHYVALNVSVVADAGDNTAALVGFIPLF